MTKRFGAVTALDRLDLTVKQGLVVGYLGPDGAGKSTTIRVLLDLARSDGGNGRSSNRTYATTPTAAAASATCPASSGRTSG